MPLSSVQSRILRLLADHRNPESFVAGAIPLAHYANDIDVFHDREAALQRAVDEDVGLLTQSGFAIEWTRLLPTMRAAIVTGDGGSTVLEWVVDSAFRFSPAIRDELFGYVLHPVNIATNKALAAAGRREPRDVIDLLAVHDRYLPMGAIVWAVSAKDLGLSPEGIIAEIRRNARYQQVDFDRLHTAAPIDTVAVARALRAAMDEADAFVREMPAGKEGLVFVEKGRCVQPEPNRLGDYIEHGGQQRGHWPSSPDIEGAMLEHDRWPQR